MGASDMRVICEFPVGTLRNALGASNLTLLGQTLRNVPGVGKPFLVFASLPAPVGQWDPDMYPDYKVSNDVAQNVAMIQAMLENPPTDALIFAS